MSITLKTNFMSNDLTSSLCNSLEKSYDKTLREISDSIIPDLIDQNVFHSIPFLSSIISIFRIGNSIKEIHHVKKIAKFLLHIDEMPKEEILKYKHILMKDEEKRMKEIEYLIILLDRYIEEEKAELLSKLYLAFLDNKINWSKFKSLSVALDSICLDDLDVLREWKHSSYASGGENTSSVARLVSSGLMIEEIPMPKFVDEYGGISVKTPSFREYTQTYEGSLFIDCVDNY